jgi:hypothetical protein
MSHGLEIFRQPGAGNGGVRLLQQPQDCQFFFFRFFSHAGKYLFFCSFSNKKTAILPNNSFSHFVLAGRIPVVFCGCGGVSPGLFGAACFLGSSVFLAILPKKRHVVVVG